MVNTSTPAHTTRYRDARQCCWSVARRIELHNFPTFPCRVSVTDLSSGRLVKGLGEIGNVAVIDLQRPSFPLMNVRRRKSELLDGRDFELWSTSVGLSFSFFVCQS